MRTIALNELRADEPMLCAGHAACPGCIDALSVRHVLAGLGPNAVVVIRRMSSLRIVASTRRLQGKRWLT